MVKGKKRNAGTLERQARQMAADLYHSANGIAPHAAYHLFDALAKTWVIRSRSTQKCWNRPLA
jgi:hypothetical protein